ncbi:archease [Thermodesulfobacteriota bacterium]
MNSVSPEYTLIDHTADLGITVQGNDLADLFQKSGNALTHLLIEDCSSKKPNPMKISISGNDLEDLMVRWLGEILYLFEGEGQVVSSIRINSISDKRLHAILELTPFAPLTHKILREIKAVTYHQIKVAKKDDIWETNVIFDL